MKLSFNLRLVLASVFLYTIALVAQSLTGRDIPDIVFYVIPAYALLTWVLFRMILRSKDKSPQRFIMSINGSVLIKLLTTAMFVAVYFFMDFPGRKTFAVAVMGIYAVFTAILVISLYPHLRR